MLLRRLGIYVSWFLCGRAIDEGNLEQNSNVVLINLISLTGIAFFVPLAVHNLVVAQWDLFSIDALLIALLTGTFLYLRSTGHYRRIALTLSIVLLPAAHYVFVTGGEGISGVLWQYFFPVFVIFTLGLRLGLVFTVLQLGAAALAALPGTGWVTASYPDGFLLRFFITMALVVLGSGFFDYVRGYALQALDRKAEELRQNVDILEQREQKISDLAYKDSLTGLANRTMVSEYLENAVGIARREQVRVAVHFMDLDRFKFINDTMGHEQGDRLLVEVAARLRAAVRSSDFLGRLGGDEFILIQPSVKERYQSVRLAEKITQFLGSPYELDGATLRVTASVGVALYPDDGENPSELLKNADVAMYHAKHRGKNTFSFYERAMDSWAMEWLESHKELHDAWERREFRLVYQPIVDLQSAEVVAVEALLRQQHADGRLELGPRLIAVAEETGFIQKLGSWVIDQAFTDFDELDSRLKLHINLSPRQLLSDQPLQTLRQAFDRTGIGADSIELEVTEHALIEDSESVANRIDKIKSMGARIALDDFGTGYSSLSYLHRFRVHTLKIDRSFVGQCATDQSARSLIQSIISMAKGMRIRVVAEGVETDAQLRFLRNCGCDMAQGYLFSPGLPAAELAEWITEFSQDAAASLPSVQAPT